MPPNVGTEVKLYRGGGPVAGIPLSPVKIENLKDQSFLAGSMRIPDDLAAGNYSMEVLAADWLESSKKKQAAATQWIDVTVVSPDSGGPKYRLLLSPSTRPAARELPA